MLAVAVAKYLDDQLPDLTFREDQRGGNVFVASMPSEPDEAVAVMPSGGVEQPDRTGHDMPTLQILVRGKRMAPRPSYELARAIYSKLACLDLVVLDEDGPDEVKVIGCTAMQSDPVPLGQDANQRHEWSLNFRLHVHAPTANRT